MRALRPVFLTCLFLINFSSSQADGNLSFTAAELFAFYEDDNGNRVDFFAQDFRAASRTPSFFVQVFGDGPDVGQFVCFGSTLAGNVTDDPVDVVQGAVHGEADLGTAGLTDPDGNPCPADIRIVAQCESTDDNFRQNCTFRESAFGQVFKQHGHNVSRSADCTVTL